MPQNKGATISVSIAAWMEVIVICGSWWNVLIGKLNFIEIAPGLMIDQMSAQFCLLTAFIVASALTHAHTFFQYEAVSAHPPELGQLRQFYVLSAFFLLITLCMFACDNLGYLWIAIELTTLVTAGLVYYSRTKHALEATWKYFLICSVGIAFSLLGTIFIFSSSQQEFTAGTLNISQLINLAPTLDGPLFKLGFIFCYVGYGTKAGIFPLHSWLPDAHSEAPAPASAMLSGVLLNCPLFALWRLSTVANHSNLLRHSLDLCVWGGALTVLAAAIFLVRQNGLKRLWAYSSIENVGIMLLAIGLCSPILFFLQAINHSLIKASLFLLSGDLIHFSGTKQLKEMKGMLQSQPITASLFAVAALASTGAPPFGAFISEWFILATAIGQCHIVPALLTLLGLTLAFVAICAHVGPIIVGSNNSKVAQTSTVFAALVPALLLILSLACGCLAFPIGSIGGAQ
jgi:hydrogenase-4 component F